MNVVEEFVSAHDAAANVTQLNEECTLDIFNIEFLGQEGESRAGEFVQAAHHICGYVHACNIREAGRSSVRLFINPDRASQQALAETAASP